jgi:hypothetical protein
MNTPVVAAPQTSSFATWFHRRRATITTVAIGTVTWPVAFGAAWRWWPTSVSPPGDRIAYVLQLAAAPSFVLLLMVTSCMRLFDTAAAENPLAGGESQRWRINQRVVSNTIEQLAIFAPLVIAIALRLPDSQLRLLPIAVTLWCAGRLMFWIGYHVAPHWRGPGFDWTFLTSCVVAGWLVSTFV